MENSEGRKLILVGIMVVLILAFIVIIIVRTIRQISLPEFPNPQTPSETSSKTPPTTPPVAESPETPPESPTSPETPVLPPKKDLSITYVSRSAVPGEEYVTITAGYSNTEPVLVSGLRLVSEYSGASYTIPNGVQLFQTGQSGTEGPILLPKGGVVVVTTGRSPVGSSFRINTCSGYLSQFQTFTPSVSTRCPLPADTLPYSGANMSAYGEACIDYVHRNLTSCKAVTAPLPINLSQSCQAFIAEQFNYNGCVRAHRTDANFYTNEWRVFLGRNAEIWRNSREEISLVAPDGSVVAEYTF